MLSSSTQFDDTLAGAMTSAGPSFARALENRGRLYGLAEPHVVREDATRRPFGEGQHPLNAFALIVAQRSTGQLRGRESPRTLFEAVNVIGEIDPLGLHLFEQLGHRGPSRPESIVNDDVALLVRRRETGRDGKR